MRKALLGVWLVLPLGAWAYHEGPGQDRLDLDTVDRLVGEAHGLAVDEQWADAITNYEEALGALPEEQRDAGWKIRLELNKARMMDSKLPAANTDLQELVREMQDAEGADPELLAEARSAFANSQYYLTWLMRLEGLPREEWEPEIEAARQTFRLVAETSEKRGDEDMASKSREDLESAIRLARIELQDLQGLPLPSQ